VKNKERSRREWKFHGHEKERSRRRVSSRKGKKHVADEEKNVSFERGKAFLGMCGDQSPDNTRGNKKRAKKNPPPSKRERGVPRQKKGGTKRATKKQKTHLKGAERKTDRALHSNPQRLKRSEHKREGRHGSLRRV